LSAPHTQCSIDSYCFLPDGGTKSSTSSTVYYKPSIGAAWTIKNVVAPATMVPAVATEVTFNVTDVFGNVLDTATFGTSTVSTGGATLGAGGAATWDSTRKLHVLSVTAASTDPFLLTVVAGTDADSVGLGASNLGGEVRVINAAGAAASVTTVNAQIAALTAQLAALEIIKDRKVSKLKYNRLARKWNAAFPSNKVWVKP
jgi:hypothetical protein